MLVKTKELIPILKEKRQEGKNVALKYNKLVEREDINRKHLQDNLKKNLPENGTLEIVLIENSIFTKIFKSHQVKENFTR